MIDVLFRRDGGQRPDINVIGTYTFTLPDLGPGGVRELRNADEPDWDD
ncbi:MULTISPECIES: hypothetical protein [unclassified Nonomuraea]